MRKLDSDRESAFQEIESCTVMPQQLLYTEYILVAILLKCMKHSCNVGWYSK